jgi:hypothetical protein
MKYKNDAQSIISKLVNFDYLDFESWIKSQNILIGGGHIIQYLDEYQRWNTKAIVNDEIRLTLSYSKQAMSLIQGVKEFDYNNFAVWFSNSIEIERGDILNYLEARHK